MASSVQLNLNPRTNVKKGLSFGDYCRTAKLLNVNVASIRAVAAVEASGGGFDKSGRAKILFERHLFYSNLRKHGVANKAYELNPHICNPDTGGYIGGAKEYDRLNAAIKICNHFNVPIAEALKACSIGRFQVLVKWWEQCGYSSAEEMFNACMEDEGVHLHVFAEYILDNGLADELRRQDWKGFASGYNGSNYRRYGYHIKMSNAYDDFKNIKIDCSAIENRQKPIGEVMPVKVEVSNNPLANTSFDNRCITEEDKAVEEIKEIKKDSSLVSVDGTSNQSDASTSSSNNLPPSTSSDSSQTASGEDPTDSQPDQTNTIWTTLETISGKIDQVNDLYAKVSVSSWVTAAIGAIVGFLNFCYSWVMENPVYAIFATVIIVAVIWFIHYAKERANLRKLKSSGN